MHLRSHVTLTEHLVALIEDEMLKVIEVQILFLDELHDSSWSSDDNMRWFGSLQDFHVISLRDTSIEALSNQTWDVFGESSKLFFDLIGQLSDIAQNQNGVWLWISLIELLQDGNNENCSLSHS